MEKQFHHVALSVRDLEKSQAFYERLGFRQVHRWDADDKSLTIVHLKLKSIVLELFAYASNVAADPLLLEVANNLTQIGVKHFGIEVSNVHICLEEMLIAGYEASKPEVTKGRTGVDYFFIKDPDGMWVEIVQDDRGY
jgi:glyoxylase I family protein